VPDSYGKRQRRKVKERKDAAREERRVARSQRRADRAAGIDVDAEGYGREAADREGAVDAEPEEPRPETERTEDG
jgi:hypothetical protein